MSRLTTLPATLAKETEVNHLPTSPKNEDEVDQALQLQHITNERDLYEKKLKAISVVVASMDKENSDVKRENIALKKDFHALGVYGARSKASSTHYRNQTLIHLRLIEEGIPAVLATAYSATAGHLRAKMLENAPIGS